MADSTHIYRASQVQRDYRRLLDEAKAEGIVQIVDSDGSKLGLADWSVIEFGGRLSQEVRNVKLLRNALAHNAGRPPSEWAETTPFAWVSWLSPEEALEFSNDVHLALQDAVFEGGFDEYDSALSGWQRLAARKEHEARVAELDASTKKLVEAAEVTRTYGEVFPADDPVSYWLIAASAGLNDMIRAGNEILREELTPDLRFYFFRLSCMHLWETVDSLVTGYRGRDEIQTFVDELPEDARRLFAEIEKIHDTAGASTVGKELVRIRSEITAHYPRLSTQARKGRKHLLRQSLEAAAGQNFTIELPESLKDLRLSFADDLLASFVVGLMPTSEDQRRILGDVANYVGPVSQFIQFALAERLMAPTEESS